MNTATQTGAASVQPTNPDLKDDEVAVKPNPRQEAIDAMADRQEKARREELDDAIAADPGLAANQESIDRQIQEANASARAAGELPPLEDDGAASVEPMHEPAPALQPEPLPDNLKGDPLAEYVVMEQGQPMFQVKVNGQEMLIPFDKAKRQLQIGTAAEVRMQEAAQVQGQLDERERALSAGEAALAQRMTTVPATPTVPVKPDLSEQDLLEEAQEIFNTAFSGTEEDAAKKLAKVLYRLQTPTTPVVQAQPIDEAAIVRKAAGAAVSAVQKVDRNKDVKKGYLQFKTDYPDIMGNAKLYKMADDMTDEIENENPDWDISQVMDEAGKRTRAWVNDLKGVEPEPPPPPPPDEITPEQPQIPPTNRQSRKSSLVRMPTAAVGAVHEAPKNVEEKPQTAQEAFRELKDARGQPT